MTPYLALMDVAKSRAPPSITRPGPPRDPIPDRWARTGTLPTPACYHRRARFMGDEKQEHPFIQFIVSGFDPAVGANVCVRLCVCVWRMTQSLGGDGYGWAWKGRERAGEGG